MILLLHLNILLEIILKHYFFNSRCLYVFTDIPNKVEIKTELPIVYYNVLNNTLDPHFIFHHHGCQDILINHENSADILIQFEKLIRFESERFNYRKYIITSKNTEFLSAKELDHVSDLLVIIPSNNTGYRHHSSVILSNEHDLENETYSLVTHVYTYRSETRIPKFLDKWFSANCSFLYGNNLFPNKLKNQNGKLLRIGTFMYEPYSIVGDNNETVDGTETHVITEFVKRYNLSPVFIDTGTDSLWGEAFDNWTGVGLIGTVAEDIVDIGYAGLFTWEKPYKFLDYTKPLVRSGVTCLVPAPRLATGFAAPLLPFSSKVWSAVLVTFCLSSLVLYILSNKNSKFIISNLEKSLTIMILIYLQKPIHTAMKTRLIKYFMALNFLYILVICTSYSSSLAEVMMIPRYHRVIKTVEDLALSDVPWGAPSDTWTFAIENAQDEEYKAIKDKFILKEKYELFEYSKQHDIGFPLKRLPYGYYAIGAYVPREVIINYRPMQENMYWEYCPFMITKSSVLLPLLDNLILRIVEAGLGANWEHHVVSKYMDMTVQRTIKFYKHDVQEYKKGKLNWVHVEGAFGILLMGYFLGAAFFIIELLNVPIRKVLFKLKTAYQKLNLTGCVV